MKTLILLTLFFTVSAWSSIETTQTAKPQIKRTLKDLYGKLNNSADISRVESDNLVLSDYTLLVSSGTWWAGSEQAENMWEKLAMERPKELNVVVVYDAPNQDVSKIKSKSAATKMYEYFDQNRQFYYWFQNHSLMDAVLIGPNGKVLFEGLLNSDEQVQKIKSLVKKREAT